MNENLNPRSDIKATVKELNFLLSNPKLTDENRNKVLQDLQKTVNELKSLV